MEYSFSTAMLPVVSKSHCLINATRNKQNKVVKMKLMEKQEEGIERKKSIPLHHHASGSS